MKVPRLETRQAVLRAVTMQDAPAMQAHFANWNVVRTIGSDIPWPYPADGARFFIDKMQRAVAENEVYFWGIFLKTQPDELVGAIEYRFLEGDDDNRGFWLSETHWNKGIMTEVVAATQDFVFLELGKTRLIVTTLCTNAGSIAIKEKTGARQVGTRPGAYHEGELQQGIWEITAQSWAEAKARMA